MIRAAILLHLTQERSKSLDDALISVGVICIICEVGVDMVVDIFGWLTVYEASRMHGSTTDLRA